MTLTPVLNGLVYNCSVSDWLVNATKHCFCFTHLTQRFPVSTSFGYVVLANSRNLPEFNNDNNNNDNNNK
eukprot:6470948-Amphidinium_carterae.3